VADQLPAGRYLEHDADYHLPWRGEEAWFLEPVAQLLTGRRPAGAAPTRIVATVVATAAGGPAEIFASPSAAVAHDVATGAATGIHTGEVERDGQTVRGFAVELAARLAALAAPGEVVVSRTVRDLTLGSALRFTARGEHGGWELFTPG
jgi:hypothetical protein